MSFIGPVNTSENIIISLENIVPEFHSLKLLIMHTPFPLDISSLTQCYNILKLDLSRNHIKSFPHLGHLRYLKVLFIHQNQLEIHNLIRIFELQEENMSQLARNILWVTYWGNKHEFLGRHYIANKTRAIACDMNMIALQERGPLLLTQQKEMIFSEQTDISHLIMRKGRQIRQLTEQAYMKELWIQIHELRRKQESLSPIVKVQKIFRGWSFRKKLRIKEQLSFIEKKIKIDCFNEWKIQIKNRKKLIHLLKQNNKQYLVQNIKNTRFERVKCHLRSLAQEAKKKVKQRKIRLKYQLKFYSIVRYNYLVLQDLYACVQLNRSSSIYIYSQNILTFQKLIVPFALQYKQGNIEISLNRQFNILYLHDNKGIYQQQVLKIMQIQKKCIVYKNKEHHDNLNSKNNKNKQKLKHDKQKRQDSLRMDRQQLVKVTADKQILQHLTRGIFFYNTNRIALQSKQKHRINYISESWLKKISIIIRLQGIWRGALYRKRNRQNMNTLLKLQRSCVKIQRWIRRLPSFMLKCFLYKASRIINHLGSSEFYLQYKNYERILEQTSPQLNIFFWQQNASVYLDEELEQLVIAWDRNSTSSRIKEKIRANYPLFYSLSMIELTGLSNALSIIKTTLHSKLKEVTVNHVFHYNTRTFFFDRNGKKYVKIVCKSRSDARFRILSLLLFTFDIQNKKKCVIETNHSFQKLQLKHQIMKSQMCFISNQNAKLTEHCRSKLRDMDYNFFMVNNKFYSRQEDLNKKPAKIEQKFLIFHVESDGKTSIQHSNELQLNSKKSLRYNENKTAHIPNFEQRQKISLEKHIQIRLSEIRQSRQQKIMIRKRSLKQFKLQRKIPPKAKNIQFIFDNKKSFNTNISSPIVVTSTGSKHMETQASVKGPIKEFPFSADVSEKNSYMSRRRQLQDKKDKERFTKNFMNINNFLQNELLNGQRRRIKTQAQNQSYKNAEEIRLSHKRQNLSKEIKRQLKFRRIRENESNHQSLLQQHSRQKNTPKKKRIASQDSFMKYEKNLGIPKQYKITFIQQHFPIKKQKVNHP